MSVTTAFVPRWRHNPPIRITPIGFIWSAIVAAACAGSHRPRVYVPEPDPCVLVAPPDSPPDSITVALPAPLRFLAAQSYETLIGVDCLGRPYPRLASEWSVQRVEGGQRWEITLDTSARFVNGDRVTANDVLAAWRSTAAAPGGELARLLVPATAVIDDRTLSVLQPDSSQLILADPSLAIPRARSKFGAASRVGVRTIDASAARDALDAGADLLVTDDPAIVSYAAHNDDLLTLPLPWDRTYVVLASESAPPDVSETFRLTLAALLADAVRADFRIAEGPFWWESTKSCATPTGTRPAATARASSRVVYQRGDRVAQGIAERLVALAGSRSARGENGVLDTLLPGLSRAGARTTALSPSAFAAALKAGDDLAYVLPFPRFAFAPCHELAMLLRAAPWLKSVIPLIDTRSVALVRRGRVGLVVDADGSLRLLDVTFGKNGKP